MTLRCDSCGAAVKRDAIECPYCAVQRAAPVPAKEPTTEDLFARLRAHSDFPELVRHEPSMKGHYTFVGCGFGFFIVFVGMFIAIAAMFQSAPAPVRWFPVIFVPFAVGLVTVLARRASLLVRAPLERVAAKVLDERLSVYGAGRHGRSRTTYHVTLFHEDGTRREYSAGARVAGDVTRGDVGVAYIKHDDLVDFRRPAG